MGTFLDHQISKWFWTTIKLAARKYKQYTFWYLNSIVHIHFCEIECIFREWYKFCTPHCVIIIIMVFITTPPFRQRQRVPWRGHRLVYGSEKCIICSHSVSQEKGTIPKVKKTIVITVKILIFEHVPSPRGVIITIFMAGEVKTAENA